MHLRSHYNPVLLRQEAGDERPDGLQKSYEDFYIALDPDLQFSPILTSYIVLGSPYKFTELCTAIFLLLKLT